MALARETHSESIKPSLDLYVSETAPSPVEKRSFLRWVLLALIAIALHWLAFWLSPRFFPPVKPAPVEVTQIDPAKLKAIKDGWKSRQLVLQKDPSKPKQNIAAPKDARYESDRNQKVDRETRAGVTDVIPSTPGNPNGKSDRNRDASKKKSGKTQKPTQDLSLAQLSNFQSLPRPASTEEEHEAEFRHGSRTPGDQSIDDPSLPVGAENMLNTVESVYYTYFARISEQLGPVWGGLARTAMYEVRPQPGEYDTQAEAVYDAKGNLLETNLVRRSGIERFDAIAIRAWTKMPSFPNPPKGLIQSDGKIHIVWTFSISISEGGGGFRVIPPDMYR